MVSLPFCHSSLLVVAASEEMGRGVGHNPSADSGRQVFSGTIAESSGGAADSTGGRTNTDTGTAKASRGVAMTTIKQNTMIDAASDDLLMLMWKEKREAHDRCVCEYITF